MTDSLNVDKLFAKVKTTEGPAPKKELIGSRRSKAKVLWDDMAATLMQDFKANKDDLEVLKPTLIVNGGASKAAFTRLNDHLGPIKKEGTAKAGEWTFSSIANLYRKEYFHGFLSGGAAQFKLSNLPKGSWLARFSAQSSKCIAISMISGENSVEHWVVPFDEDSNIYYFEGLEFPSFDAFREHFQKEVLPSSESTLLDENIAPCLAGKIQIAEKIGGGNFGTVFRAFWNKADGSKLEVAAKRLGAGDAPTEQVVTGDDTDELKEEGPVALPGDVEAESNLLKNMRHKHVVSYFGMVFINEVPFIVTDLMKGGSLLGFLLNSEKKRNDSKEEEDPNKPKKHQVTPKDLVRMCKEAALGMDYLSTNGVVHRDLAARNLLVSEASPNATVKVTDFGLSRKTGGAYYVKTGNTSDPVLWAAPESFKQQPGKDVPFKGRVSTRSDRWSFGVILNEVFNFGVEPYSGCSKAEIRSHMSDRKPVFDYLELKDAPKAINKLIVHCTSYESQQRPDFKTIAAKLAAIEKRLEVSGNEWNKPDDTPIAEATGNNQYDDDDGDEDVAIANQVYDQQPEVFQDSDLTM